MDEGYAGTGQSEGETYWVTIEESASEAGVPPSTVIAWIAEGSIVSQTASGTDGMVAMVRRSEVVERARRAAEEQSKAADGQPAVTTPGADLAPLLKSLPELIRDLVEAKERAAKAETKLEFVTERLREVRSERDDLLQKISSAGSSGPAAPTTAAPPAVSRPAPEPVRVSEEAARASEGLNDILQGLREMNDRISHREPRPLEDLAARRSTPSAGPEPDQDSVPKPERRAATPPPAQEDEDDIWEDAPRAAEAPAPAGRPTLTRVEEPEDEDDIWDEGIYPDRRTRAATDAAAQTPVPEPEERPSEPATPVRPEGWNPAPRDPGLKSAKRWWKRRG